MEILEIGLDTIGESILALILSPIPLVFGLISIWIALYYFKTGIPFGYPEPIEEDKTSYSMAEIIGGSLVFGFGLFAVFAAFQGILKHYMALDLASYLACIFPILITFAAILFLYWYWKKEEPTKNKGPK